ncbi:901_t:CDS:2 [Acaulospora colombiana]|uniref:901_t:CDS:1 n=1 Tax=Acaulospora colombiana TaxID=27376 RepID=A0ACA9LXE0_9GLOM|nr:901_t:CDS:2 [Acaulospora colombiana]
MGRGETDYAREEGKGRVMPLSLCISIISLSVPVAYLQSCDAMEDRKIVSRWSLSVEREVACVGNVERGEWPPPKRTGARTRRGLRKVGGGRGKRGGVKLKLDAQRNQGTISSPKELFSRRCGIKVMVQ